MALTTGLTQCEKIALHGMYLVSGLELATLDIFQIANVLAPSALNMALTTGLTPCKKIALREMDLPSTFEPAILDTF